MSPMRRTSLRFDPVLDSAAFNMSTLNPMNFVVIQH